jgi:hypothetical protein
MKNQTIYINTKVDNACFDILCHQLDEPIHISREFIMRIVDDTVLNINNMMAFTIDNNTNALQQYKDNL